MIRRIEYDDATWRFGKKVIENTHTPGMALKHVNRPEDGVRSATAVKKKRLST